MKKSLVTNDGSDTLYDFTRWKNGTNLSACYDYSLGSYSEFLKKIKLQVNNDEIPEKVRKFYKNFKDSVMDNTDKESLNYFDVE